jgi:deoxyribodipyrimidine photo-lyase
MPLFLGNQRNNMSRLTHVLDFENGNNNCVYLMTKSFRMHNNYTLQEAINFAETKGLSLIIYIVQPYEENSKNINYFKNMISDLSENLRKFTNEVSYKLREEISESLFGLAQAIFIDKMYLRFDLDFYEKIKAISYKNKINLFTVEANVFVPVMIASDKEEYSAKTIRNKINSKLNDYRDECMTGHKLTKAEKESFEVLNDFLQNKLSFYHLHNDPSLNYTSLLSPYLKFGFISPVSIYNHSHRLKGENLESFLEELIVRRELAYNFVYYNPTYDDFNYLTYDWAYRTMNHHLKDKRDYIYTKEDYVNLKTHDPYFNAAMKEMIYLGRMHSYMRMYWCKKIIEWSRTYEEAYKIAIELNNYYFLDGLTPNGYAGVAWCFGKHDRAWTEREIFGKLRYMNANGLERKFDIAEYVKKMNLLGKEE